MSDMNDHDYQRLYMEVEKELVTPTMRRKLADIASHACDPMARDNQDLRTALAAAQRERDAAVRECDELRKAGAWKPSEVWREEVADEVAEAIAAFVMAEADERREIGLSYRAVEVLAADIRSGAWRKETP